jgi:hypothetical protein
MVKALRPQECARRARACCRPRETRPPVEASGNSQLALWGIKELILARASQQRGEIMPELSAPKVITFIVSVIVAIIAVVIHYAHVSIPHVHSGFVVLLIGYLILVAGNVLRGV